MSSMRLSAKKYLSSISGSTTEPYSHMHFAWTIDFGLRIQKPFYKNKHEMSSLHQNSPGKQWLQPVYNQKLLQFLSCVEPCSK